MIYIASDHRGFSVKEKLRTIIEEKLKLKTEDLGTHSDARVDSMHFAKLVCSKVLEDENNLGILICWTGINMSISANKIKGIRAAQIFSENTARLAKEHNNLNVLCFGEIDLTAEKIFNLIKIFLNSEFLGGRYEERNKMLEN